MPKGIIVIFIGVLIISNIFTFLSMNIRLEAKASEMEQHIEEMKDIVYLYAADSTQDAMDVSEKIEFTDQTLSSMILSVSENANNIEAIKVNHSKMWNNFNILFDIHAGEWKERWVKTPEGPTLLLED
tara:strand:- start:1379 stop:1762 length:384 start_codon:yes stop_codon:yes gene_type:complete